MALRFFVISLLAITSLSCADKQHFSTTTGVGPDKWGSVWLIRRHIDSAAIVSITDDQKKLKNHIVLFDTPDAELRRTPESTAYEKLLSQYDIDDPVALKIGKIIHDMEVNNWGVKMLPESPRVEAAFRGLQLKQGRTSVSEACYLEFFDRVSYLLENSSEMTDLDSVVDSGLCAPTTSPNADTEVEELNLDAVLAHINSGKNIVFVDTRERLEYEEYHIPGAIRLQLRDISQSSLSLFDNADLVIPYCVKDFRGYEVARKLNDLGLHNVAIMNPYGVKGWRSAGLPVAGQKLLSESEALNQLMQCASEPQVCMKQTL